MPHMQIHNWISVNYTDLYKLVKSYHILTGNSFRFVYSLLVDDTFSVVRFLLIFLFIQRSYFPRLYFPIWWTYEYIFGFAILLFMCGRPFGFKFGQKDERSSMVESHTKIQNKPNKKNIEPNLKRTQCNAHCTLHTKMSSQFV